MQKSILGLALLIALSGCTGGYPTMPPYLQCFVDVPFKPLARATLRQTGQPLDLAIQGEGYFMLREKEGAPFRYTRHGQFRLQDGRLVTQDGRYQVSVSAPTIDLRNVTAPGPAFPADVTRTEISPQGLVSIERPSTTGLQSHGQLILASFPNREGLRDVSPGIYEETCASGAPMIEMPRAGSTTGTLRVGVLEVEAAPGASDTIGSPRFHVSP
jgi:flagellar basal body rod protein FlgG